MAEKPTVMPRTNAPVGGAVNPLASYSGGGLQVGGANVGFNPQSFVGSDAYNFIRDQGMDAIQRRAGAAGTLLTGGTLKDLTQFGQGNAATFWGNQLDHDYRMAALNADISSGNASRQLSGLSSLAGYGLSAAGGMAGAYGNYGQAGAAGTYGAANAINAGMGAVGNTLADYFAKRRAAQTTPPYVGTAVNTTAQGIYGGGG